MAITVPAAIAADVNTVWVKLGTSAIFSAKFRRCDYHHVLRIYSGGCNRVGQQRHVRNNGQRRAPHIRQRGAAAQDCSRISVDPLRKAYPQIAEYINLPLRKGRGKKLSKNKCAVLSRKVDSLTRAVWDAARLRAIWVDQYGERPKNYQSAEEITARRTRSTTSRSGRRAVTVPRDPWGPHGSRKKKTTLSR